MGLFSKSVAPLNKQKLKDIIPMYNEKQNAIIEIGKCLYQGYLPDSALTFGEYAYLRGFHDYLLYTRNKRGKKARRKTLQVPKFITQYLNKLIYTENVSMNLSSDNNPQLATQLNEYLTEVLEDNDYWTNTADLAETMWNLGGKIEYPTVKDNKISIEFVTANRFYPTSWNNKHIYEGTFVEKFKKKGYYYTKLTWIEYKGNTYRIKRELYKSKDGINLGDKESYKSMFKDPEVMYLHNFDSVPFSYCKPRIKNNQVLQTPLGLPVWFNSIDTIADIDLIFDTKFREVRYGGRQKVVPSYSLKQRVKKTTSGGVEYETIYDPDDPTITAFNLDPNEKQSVVDLTSPIRDMSFINLLNQSFDIVGVQTGFSNGTFVFNGTSMKTATEVITERTSTYQTKVFHEHNLKEAHKNLFLSILEMTIAFELDDRVKTIPDDLKINIEFDDSVIIDKEKILEDMRADAMDEIIPVEDYVEKKYKLSPEKAIEKTRLAKKRNDDSALEAILNGDTDE